MDITQLLLFTHEQRASDLHISAGESPMIRVDGDLKKVDAAALSAEQCQAMLYDIMSDNHRKLFEETNPTSLAQRHRVQGVNSVSSGEDEQVVNTTRS